MTVEEMERELIKLDADGRSQVYYFLIDLMERDAAFEEISEEDYDKLWATECRRRIESLDHKEVQAIPADEVFARARTRLAEHYLELAKELAS
jgi:hypothetical protein